MMALSTGVYNKNEEEFFYLIKEEKIDVFIDIRQRRGMRGKKYSFVNKTYLQKKLSEMNVKYLYIKELAPTSEIREEQKKQDIAKQVLKSAREFLGDVFISMYCEKILSKYDVEKLIHDLNGKRVLFFCVEEKACACHRHLVLKKLQEYNVDCKNI